MRKCRDCIDQDARPNEHENLLAVTQCLAGLRYNNPKLFEILGGRRAMIESPLLQELIAERTRETMIANIMTVLITRFGANAETIESELKTINDEARLKGLIKHAVTARTLNSFRKQLTP